MFFHLYMYIIACFCVTAEMMERDKFMDPAQAKELGLIDKILERLPSDETKIEESKPAQ